jgi:hypothetical protein
MIVSLIPEFLLSANMPQYLTVIKSICLGTFLSDIVMFILFIIIGMIILKCISKKWDEGWGLDSSGLGLRTVAGLFERVNGISDSVK